MNELWGIAYFEKKIDSAKTGLYFMNNTNQWVSARKM